MSWIAKNKFTGEIFEESKCSDIYDCQKWIDKNIDQHKLKEDYAKQLANDECVKRGSFKDYSFIELVFSIELAFRCNMVLCWNVEQNRFCDGFDF